MSDADATLQAPEAVLHWTRTFTALLTAEVWAFVRSRLSLIFTAAVPLLMLFLNALLEHGHALTTAATMADAADSLTVGVFVLGLFGYATRLASYRERGVFGRLRCAPVPAWQVLGAPLLVQMMGMLAQGMILVIVVGAVYGVVPGLSGGLLAAAVLLTGGLVALLLAQLIVALMRTSSGVNAAARVVFIAMMMLLDLVAYHVHLPGPLALIARLNPAQLLQDLLEKVLVGQNWRQAARNLVGLLAWLAVAGPIAITRFRWERDV